MQTITRVTEGQVHQAMIALDAEGTKATVQNIRDRIGSGSFSTIAKYMKTWDPEALDGPAEIPEAPDGAAAAIWATAYTKAWISLDATIQAERQRAEAAEATTAEYLAGLDDQAQQLAKERQRALELEEEARTAREEITRYRMTLERTEERARALATRLEESEAERAHLFSMIQARLDLEPGSPTAPTLKTKKAPTKAKAKADTTTPSEPASEPTTDLIN